MKSPMDPWLDLWNYIVLQWSRIPYLYRTILILIICCIEIIWMIFIVINEYLAGTLLESKYITFLIFIPIMSLILYAGATYEYKKYVNSKVK